VAAAADELPELIQRLTPRIATYFPEMGPSRVMASGRPRELDSCRLYKMEIVSANGTVARMAVKVFRAGPRRAYNIDKALRTQYDSLQEAVLLAGRVPGVRAPRPLDTLPDLGVLVMEWVDGRRLLDRLGSDLTGATSEALVRSCGEWLRHFHELRRTDPCDPRIAEKLRDARFCVERLSQERLPDELLRRVETHMVERAAVLEGIVVPSCYNHRDFSVSNVMVDGGGRLVVLDIGSELAPMDSDVAAFLVSLEKAPLHPLRLVLSQGRIRRLQKAFLQGYAGPGAEPSPFTAFQFMRLLLRTSCYYLRCYGAHPVRHFWLRHFFARRLAGALEGWPSVPSLPRGA
jgi:tRNA A-37 threonylcarbamoyl transferase component Bud32